MHIKGTKLTVEYDHGLYAYSEGLISKLMARNQTPKNIRSIVTQLALRGIDVEEGMQEIQHWLGLTEEEGVELFSFYHPDFYASLSC